VTCVMSAPGDHMEAALKCDKCEIGLCKMCDEHPNFSRSHTCGVPKSPAARMPIRPWYMMELREEERKRAYRASSFLNMSCEMCDRCVTWV
jgi:hypothetical protein